MATINVGKIRPTYRGEYDATKDYVFLDWVTHEGSSYLCITLQGAPAGTALTDETCWICLAKKGTDGITPTFEIGTVTTDAAGASASVTISGTAPDYVLNFTIPKGDKGDTGATGASGVFTGPLMPTTAYWCNAVASSYYYYLPSGGTWAWFTISFPSEGVAGDQSVYYAGSISCGVGAGGTRLGGISVSGSQILAQQTLCWRIQ